MLRGNAITIPRQASKVAQVAQVAKACYIYEEASNSQKVNALSCGWQVSTATMEVSSSSSAIVAMGGRAIDRHNPIIRDPKRTSANKFLGNNGKEASSSSDRIQGTSPLSQHVGWDLASSTRHLLEDLNVSEASSSSDRIQGTSPLSQHVGWDLASSTRHLLEDLNVSEASSSSPANQVVVLRVSLHCKGCEGKVRRHLSRMEGVTSYTIDFKAKKVIIVGHVTPTFAVNSVSKVKTAQLWSLPPA